MNTQRLVVSVLASALVLPGNSTAKTTDYTFVLLHQAISGGQRAHVNAAGQVALSVLAEENDPRACRWSITDKEALSLGTAASHDLRSRAMAINDRGHVVGTVFEEENHLAHVFHWTPDSGMQRLASFGGSQTIPFDINNRGQIVGRCIDADGLDRAGLWMPDGEIRDLGSLVEETENMRSLTGQDSSNIGIVPTELGDPVANSDGKFVEQAVISSVLRRQSSSAAMNDQGWVVGTSLAVDSLKHPVLWKPEIGMVDFGVPPGYLGGAASDINDRAQVTVVLFKHKPFKGGFWGLGSPFLWTEDAGLAELASPPGYNDVRPAAINNDGDILLWVRTVPDAGPTIAPIDYTSFLLSGGELRELPQLEGADFTHYSGINDSGYLVGSANDYQFDADGEVVNRSAKSFVVSPNTTK